MRTSSVLLCQDYRVVSNGRTNIHLISVNIGQSVRNAWLQILLTNKIWALWLQKFSLILRGDQRHRLWPHVCEDGPPACSRFTLIELYLYCTWSQQQSPPSKDSWLKEKTSGIIRLRETQPSAATTSPPDLQISRAEREGLLAAAAQDGENKVRPTTTFPLWRGS